MNNERIDERDSIRCTSDSLVHLLYSTKSQKKHLINQIYIILHHISTLNSQKACPTSHLWYLTLEKMDKKCAVHSNLFSNPDNMLMLVASSSCHSWYVDTILRGQLLLQGAVILSKLRFLPVASTLNSYKEEVRYLVSPHLPGKRTGSGSSVIGLMCSST